MFTEKMLYFPSGDIVYVQEKTGAVFMKDRIKELIKYKGSQVWVIDTAFLLSNNKRIENINKENQQLKIVSICDNLHIYIYITCILWVC